MDGSIALEAPRLAGDAPPPTKSRWSLRRPDDSRNPMPTMLQAAYEQPVTRHSTLVGAFYLVSDPEGVKRVFLDNVANYPKTALERRFFSAAFGDGLLSSEGEVWRGHRRIMAPAFSPANVAAYTDGMAQDVLAFQPTWDAADPDQPVDVARDMTRLTLNIIARAMFSTAGEALGDVMERSVAEAMKTLRPGLLDFVPGIEQLIAAGRARRMRAVWAELDAAVARLIAEREAGAGPQDGPPDLLARLIAARDAETGAKMSAREVRDQILTIFIAGHETTAAAMAWIWYLLSQHPEAEARLHAELDAVLGGRAPTNDDLPKLAYTRMVAEEAMRFYPPAPGTSTRIALAADEVCGVTIPKGAYIAVAPWVTHRHRGLWEHPERFDPERFSKARSEGRHRFAWIPFGAGPRVCIGAVLATTEILIVLASLAQRYTLALKPGHEVLIQHQVTMRPKGGLPMLVRRR
jgi:cytochrome P450